MAESQAVATKQQQQEHEARKQELEKLKQQIENKQKKEIVALGDSAVFVSRDEQGFVRIFYKDVPLKEGIHFNKISGKCGINSEGYNRLNQIANVTLVKPSTVIVDGREMPNPYVERDPETGCIEMVWTRTIGVGFAPTGNLVIVDKSLVFSLTTYLIQDLQAKIKDHPTAGTWGVQGDPPESWKGIETKWKTAQSGKKYPDKTAIEIEAPKDARLHFMPVKKAGPTYVGMWLDFSHPEILTAWNEYTQRLKFADRIADTICSRNVLRNHPAIGIFDVSEQFDERTGTATVRVFGYKHDLSIKDFKEVARAAQNNDLERAKEVAGNNVQAMADEEPEEAQYEDVVPAAAETEKEDQAEQRKKAKSGKGGGTAEALDDDEATGAPPDDEPPADNDETPSAKDELERLARDGNKDHSPVKIVEAAKARGYKVTLYTELNEDQAREVLADLLGGTETS